MLDSTFEAAFRRLFVYNILFEDSEVDGDYLKLDETSRVLGISAAGCGLASMVRFHPAHIDAVDINHHHLALAALKMAASRDVKSYGLFYDMFGHGWLNQPEAPVRKLSESFPGWLQSYWQKNHHRFNDSVYGQGLTAWMLSSLRNHAGLGTAWMHDFVKMPQACRVSAIRELAEPAMRRPLVEGMLRSPLNQLALGVNFSQKERLLENGTTDIVDFMLRHLERVAETDCETNWFAWYAAAGHYNHDNPSAVPPFLRKHSHERSKESPTKFEFHHDSIFAVLSRANANTWTHYSLCDAVDWMPQPMQVQLLKEILRTAQPGAVVLMRSVSDANVVESCHLADHFVHLAEESADASQRERSCQYRRVDFYQVNP